MPVRAERWRSPIGHPICSSLFMFLLTIGQTILMKPDVIGNWQYLVLVLLCAALSDPDPLEEYAAK